MPAIESAMSIEAFKSTEDKVSDRNSSANCITIGTDCSGMEVSVWVLREVVDNVPHLFSSEICKNARRTIIEQSPVGSSGSNGVVERAAQTIEGQIRVMKSALEGRIGKKVDAEKKMIAFMAEYAGYLVNRLEVGKDGKTDFERSRGKKAKVMG